MDQNSQKEKKYSRKELEDLQTLTKYKEAFDTFDWNRTTKIATHVSKTIKQIWRYLGNLLSSLSQKYAR